MSDFTEGQKALIADLAERRLRELLKDSGYLPAHKLREEVLGAVRRHLESEAYVTEYRLRGRATELGLLTRDDLDCGRDRAADADAAEARPAIPDRAAAEQIAAQAIRDWRESQPNVWDVRRHLAAKLGAGTLGLALALLLLDTVRAQVFEKPDTIRGAVHWLAGSDARINKQLAEIVQRWKVDATEDPAMSLEAVFQNKLAGWVEGRPFSERVSGAVHALATEGHGPNNPIRKLIVQTLEDNPLLMFHGAARLNQAVPVSVQGHGCGSMVSNWVAEGRVDLLPESAISTDDPGKPIEALCSTAAEMRTEISFEVPFFARFFKGGGLPPDTVYLILRIEGFPSVANRPICSLGEDVEETGCIMIDAEGNPQPDPPVEVTPAHLEIEYNSMDPELRNQNLDVVDLAELLRGQGNGFYTARIEGHVQDQTADTSPAAGPKERELIHSISVTLRDDADLPRNTAVDVRAIVLVNKKAIQ